MDPDVFALGAEFDQQVEAGERSGAGAGSDDLTLDMSLPASSSPLRMAAATMMAVPC